MLETSKNVFTNSLYCSNYYCAFLSLIFSGIKPIVDFGWMMTIGLMISILVHFLLPTLKFVLPPEDDIGLKMQKNLLSINHLKFAKNGTEIFVLSCSLILSVIGISNCS